ncbi:hypothetical protein COB18_01050 [Candidatus Kaiserbacteria bacterium]|nr:MAG: hypothetical protein COB18_01050 [Candidatus Kaiserbacteria bacterium]
MKNELSQDLKPRAEKIARELIHADKIEGPLVLDDGNSKLWVSKIKKGLIVFHTLEIDGVRFFIGTKVE